MFANARSISAPIFCFLFAVAAAKAAQDDWLTYRHDSARTGTQPFASDLSDPAKISNLHVVAQFPPVGSSAIAGGFKASPIVVNGTAFIGGVDGYFYAFDAASGTPKWQYPRAVDHALIGSCGKPTDFAGGWGSYGIPSSATYAKINGQDAVIFGAPDPDPNTDGGAGSARLFALPLSANPNNPQPIWKSDIVAHVNCSSGSALHERIAYSSPLLLGDKVYVGVHDTGDNPIQQGRVRAVDLNTGKMTGFQFLGAGNAPGDGSLGGGVWNALATDGGSVYFTTGNTRPAPWCVFPYYGKNCPPATEPPNNNGLGMIKVDSTTGAISWKYQTVPFELDGDPDWAAGVTVMSTSCGKLTASVQKDGWSYAIGPSGPQPQLPPEPHPQCPAPPPSPGPGLSGPSWQFPPTTNGGWFTDCNQVHGDDDYRRPGAAWNDVFIVRTGGENLVLDGVGANASKLHALNACATAEQDRVRWITGDISNNTAANGHISFSSPTVTGGIVFIGTNQNKTDNKGHLVAFADPSVAPASQQVCSNPPVPLPACNGPYAPVWSLQPILDIPMPDGGSLASMRNEPVLAEGRVFVATTPSATSPNAGHVYILAPEDDTSTIIPEIFVPDSVTTIIESE